MRPEPALLLASLAVVVAVATLVGALHLVSVTRRARRRTRRGEIALVEAAIAVERGSIRAHAELKRASRSIKRMESTTQAMGDRIEGSIKALRQQRADIEHLRARRLIPAVRLFRVAGIAARVAVLWR